MTQHDDIIMDTKKRMDGAIASLKHVLLGLHTGRASASLLDPIKVEAYGDFVPVSQLGTVNVPEPRMITIQVWDKSVVKNIEKAIANSGLGLNPVSEGQIVRIPIPDLTEDRRRELSKKVNEYAEQSKIALRNVRRDSIDSFKKLGKEKAISEDQFKSYSNDIQKITDDFSAKVEELATQKSKEILSI
ncbi:MAG: ribosome recycling factor [Candidatus Midichloria sp.]|uniref:Ribosome-recycling factor, mitochondrial n=1 Tax=Hyalomma marginatum TaxID=34627 RepID=A0A8S4BW19_9ACAR|nr:ribosome recycling factor [Hyalomma marginatum]CAG7592443.1 ribosome recycling factor [Hyalomma marginatum]